MQIDFFPNICLKQASMLIDYSINRGKGKTDADITKANSACLVLFSLVLSLWNEKNVIKGLFQNLFTLMGLVTEFCPVPFLFFSKIVKKIPSGSVSLVRIQMNLKAFQKVLAIGAATSEFFDIFQVTSETVYIQFTSVSLKVSNFHITWVTVRGIVGIQQMIASSHCRTISPSPKGLPSE